MNSISSRNENERNQKKAFQLFQHFSKKNTQQNKSLNRDFVELKLNIPMMKEESPKRTPKNQSLFRHKLSKSISSPLNLSSMCNQNISYILSPMKKDKKEIVNDTKFLQYRNTSLMRNYKDDELINIIRNKYTYLFNTSTLKLLDDYFNQLLQSRQSETDLLFTKFKSSSDTYNIHDWKAIVSINYGLTHSLIKIIETLYEEHKKYMMNTFHQSFNKLPQISISTTPQMRNKNIQSIHNNKQDTIIELKRKIAIQEGHHKLTTYHLEEEIKDLTYLLEKQKDYSESNKEMESQIMLKNNSILQLKRDLYKRIEESENESIVNRDKHNLIAESVTKMNNENELLNQKIIELEKKLLDQNILVHKHNIQTKEHQKSFQVLLKEKEQLIDDINSIKNKYDDALLIIQESQK